VVMENDAGLTTFYVNGVPAPNSEQRTPLTPTSFTIGSANGVRFFNGAIDDVRIYSRAFSSNEVAQLYAVESTPDSPPFITQQPQNTVVPLGFPTNLTVTATGLAPLSYQWLFDGTNITSATNSSLAFASPQLTNAGIYSVVATNSLGSITSSIAVLQVLPPDAPSIQANGVPVVGTMIFTNSVQVTLSGGFLAGYLFYTLDGSAPTVDSSVYIGAFTLTNSAMIQAMSLSGDFSETSQAPPVTVQIIPTYNMQLSVSGSGTINANPASGPYASNSVVTLTANAAANWAFDYWTGNASGNQNPLSLSVDGPTSVQAIFVQTAYPLTVSTPGGGSVTANGQIIPPATFYPVGSVVTLAAVANPGWSFLGWQGNASGTNNSLNVTMNQTNNIQAIFGTVVGTNTLGGGRIVLSQPNPIPYGTTLTASAVPNAGKYLVAWGGAASGTNTPTTVTVTSTNPTVSALFTTLPSGEYSLGVIVMGNGSVAISPQQDYYNPGETVTLVASTTYPGTSFYGWTGDTSGTNSPIEMVMNSNIVVQANFVDVQPPVVAITNITAGMSVSNALFTVMGTATDNVAVVGVFYSLNNGVWTNVTTGNNWANWSAAVTLIAGTNTFAVYAMDIGGNRSLTNSVSFVLAFQITTTNLPMGTNGFPYNVALGVLGGQPPLTWTNIVGTLQSGLSLSTNGIISGTPTVAATNNITFQVTDSLGRTLNRALTLIITTNAPPLHIATTSLPNGTNGVVYNQPLIATNGYPPYTWTKASGTLPPGLTLSTNGIISGTPTTNGTSSFTVQVKDAVASSAVKPLTLVVVTNSSPLRPVLSSAGFNVSGGQFHIQLSGVAGQNYTLQMSTNLISTNWLFILVTNAPAGPFTITDPNATNVGRFYRIMLGP